MHPELSYSRKTSVQILMTPTVCGCFLVTGSQASVGEGGDGDGEAENITNWHNCGLGM